MTCGGCSGAVNRVLAKTEGISSYDVSLEKQEVLVTGTIPYDELLEKIKKTGKEVCVASYLISRNEAHPEALVVQVRSGETLE
jgi:copper chaperone